MCCASLPDFLIIWDRVIFSRVLVVPGYFNVVVPELGSPLDHGYHEIISLSAI